MDMGQISITEEENAAPTGEEATVVGKDTNTHSEEETDKDDTL